jgi:hypothetical protein
MNSYAKEEDYFHKHNLVRLNDACEDVPPPPLPNLSPSNVTTPMAGLGGNTYGNHPRNKNGNRGCIAKLLHTGDLETLALSEPQNAAWTVGRLGIGLRTQVMAWENRSMRRLIANTLTAREVEHWQEKHKVDYRVLEKRVDHWPEGPELVYRKMVKRLVCWSEEKMTKTTKRRKQDAKYREPWNHCARDDFEYKEVETGVSGHFGIAAGIRILCSTKSGTLSEPSPMGHGEHKVQLLVWINTTPTPSSPENQ